MLVSKQEVIQQLERLYGKQLPPKTWFIYEHGVVEKHEGLAFGCQPDQWWFLDDHGYSIYDENGEYSIHQDLLCETEEDAKLAAEKYCLEEIARLQHLLAKLKGK
jgi:hypothetical protein